ncbi:MAG: D-2-hydroxyacid dehydrogenase [Xanthomonadales bacterium]|nr:D-2-hydroxyacid dehydrogenase [Xanthomonadales bacterium]
MTQKIPAHGNAVLVVCSDAADYLPLLDSLSTQGVALSYAETPAKALQIYQGQAVLLAQPDMAAAIIDQLPNVRWVQSTWAGITSLLKSQRQDFLLTGVKDIFGPQMAEYALGYILAHELKLLQRQQKQSAGRWWRQPSGSVMGKTLGVMGTGSIGCHIARSAVCFGLEVIGFSRSGAARDEFKQVFAADQLHDFLAESDYVVGVLPNTAATSGMMDAASFAAMKDTALFINIGRGNLVDEAALVAALAAGTLAGAVLDVFQHEPLPQSSPLWQTPKLVVTGHVAARSWPRDIAGIFTANYQRFTAGQPLENLIDRQRGH